MSTRRKTVKQPRHNIGVGSSASSGNESIATIPNPSPAPAPTLAQVRTDPEMLPSADQINIEAMSEEEELLRETEEEEERKLLSLRQKFKKTQSNLTKTRSHLSFIRGCKRLDRTPKGLRVGVTCNALLAELSTVKRRFDSTKVSAESEYVEALEDHYKIAEQKLQTEATTLLETMIREANKSRAEVKRKHVDMLQKTEDNIKKLKERLEEAKKKKLENLQRPERERRQRDTRYRPYSRNSPAQPRPQRQNTTRDRENAPPRRPQIQSNQQQAQPMADEVARLSGMLQTLMTRLPPAQPQQRPPLQPYPLGQQPPQLLAPGGQGPPGQPPQLLGGTYQGFR